MNSEDNTVQKQKIEVPIMADLHAQGRSPEILFWVGCAGSFDSRAQKITHAFVKILTNLGIDYAILGKEESCTGDPARRAGNEFVFQMMALQNIQVMNMYNVKKIVTTCPHGFNIIKNEYPDLGGNYEVMHHTQFLQSLIKDGRLKLENNDVFKNTKITYHDSCYIGRVNGEYEAPRDILEQLDAIIVEMDRNRENALCCGAGGAQFFKEEEPGDRRVSEERSEEIAGTGAQIVAANCPFCITMLEDGLKSVDKTGKIVLYDLAELIVEKNNWK